MFYVDNKSKFKMIQNDLKSFQNPKIMPELSICFVKHFLFHLFTYLWSALNCVENMVLLCDQFSYFWCQPYFGCLLLLGNSLSLPPYPWLLNPWLPATLQAKPFSCGLFKWDAGSDLTHQMNVSVQLWVSRLDGRGQISQKGCVLVNYWRVGVFSRHLPSLDSGWPGSVSIHVLCERWQSKASKQTKRTQTKPIKNWNSLEELVLCEGNR